MDVNAQFIKKYRQQNLWSQQQLADMAGLSLRTLQRVEKTSTASLETIKSLAAVFEVSASHLTDTESSSTEQAAPDKQVSINDTKTKRRRLIIGLGLVCIVNAIALGILFYQHDKNAIEASTFHLLKNLISITTVTSVVIALIQGIRRKLLFRDDFW
ncbi:helix-turn-helix domain-containing protein [Pseudidiomarina sp. E22-M8]|uniref:helix-turn-helix domain-containing protein n=1 Tax=Pseudidiomarina sp. E22-M8 TaxID=3424768 RepID=UPI00403CA98D